SDYVHVKKAIDWRFNLASHNEFIDYVDSVSLELWNRAFWKFLGELLQLALKAAQFLGDEIRTARLTGELGDLQLRQGDNGGYTLLRQAIDIYEAQALLPDKEIERYVFLK